ncbi:hypothetical protein A2810_03230 [candidate division Kazan bacterium RIFCSPHIGHO2_01_FULL_49_10]|uniref:Uncharacterized protein n=1 Tax=candidate division Kazan bacterium RIFCSPLOWO2_01_FULL_48_13 TaxID=1798539 RepID=A0A1F4PN73_UNCK3|nr:MAG: hypothetical protein A2810_03230 [candidate division Kazan bacterium RIFCSPHIGHO2_01_FULL_49_10]OGB85104.1 MAG: hypothetical protein A2994_03665 [candidate division Kazan bacterium RIFCSPLOWO2_01_FULL_48_13]
MVTFLGKVTIKLRKNIVRFWTPVVEQSSLRGAASQNDEGKAWIPDQVWDDKEKQPEGLDPE